MRAGLVCAMTMAGLLLLAQSAAAPAPAAACPTSAGMKDASKATKPSSFAPRPVPANRAYGQPIGSKILTKRVKKKPAPPGDLPAA